MKNGFNTGNPFIDSYITGCDVALEALRHMLFSTLSSSNPFFKTNTRTNIKNTELDNALKIFGFDRIEDFQIMQSRFKKLSKQFHPDLNRGDKDCEEKVKEINNAWDIILKELGRKVAIH